MVKKSIFILILPTNDMSFNDFAKFSGDLSYPVNNFIIAKYTENYTLYTVQCTSYSVRCTVLNAYCTENTQ